MKPDKLNFVLEYTKNKKHYAVHFQIYTFKNLLCEFERIKTDKDLGKLTIIQYVPSHKQSVEVAHHWNECYKKNGTYNEWY